MEEINVFLHVMKSLKNKLLKIVIISAVAALCHAILWQTGCDL